MPSKGNERRIGLARALSKLGYCSRSQAAQLIRAGRVRVNELARRDPGTPVHLAKDCIQVDGAAIDAREKIYLMLNKPRGLVTTASDDQGRETVYSALKNPGQSSPQATQWVAPVGRLDKASEGLLLLTNDSEWAARIAAPETHLEKIYHVQIDTLVDEKFAQQLVRGVREKVQQKMQEKMRGKDWEKNGDAPLLRARHVRVLRSGEKNCWLEIVLDEGKNRQIRRMLSSVGVEVLRLVRVAIGPLRLGKLAKGSHRPLTDEEKRALDRAMAKSRRQPFGVWRQPQTSGVRHRTSDLKSTRAANS
ncbi:MAG TPA: pseudouridine synthase [Candidatus Sulfotelmatobacter sp.]